jgi:DNA-binding response OmpR family regulator
MQPFRLSPTLSKASIPQEVDAACLQTTTRTHQKMDYPELKGQSVLLVEDNWQVGKALKSALEGIGMLVAGPVATVADAARLAADRTPNLAVVDINLKDEFSYGLIDQMHAQGVRVVVVSGYAVLPNSTAKVAAILQKPFNGRELLETLRQVIGKTGET